MVVTEAIPTGPEVSFGKTGASDQWAVWKTVTTSGNCPKWGSWYAEPV